MVRLMLTALAMLISGPRLSRKPGQSTHVQRPSGARSTSGMNVIERLVCPISISSFTSESALTRTTFFLRPCSLSSLTLSITQPWRKLTKVLLPAPVLPITITMLQPSPFAARHSPAAMQPWRHSSRSSTLSLSPGSLSLRNTTSGMPPSLRSSIA